MFIKNSYLYKVTNTSLALPDYTDVYSIKEPKVILLLNLTKFKTLITLILLLPGVSFTFSLRPSLK
jgi:hypothetical protein